MQLLGSEPVLNTVSRSPWLFASTDQAKGGGKKRRSKGKVKGKTKANRRKSVKNKTRRRMPRIYN